VSRAAKVLKDEAPRVVDRAQQVKDVIALMEQGKSENASCAEVGINRSTFRHVALRVGADNEYARACEAIAQDQVESLESAIADMRNGTIDAGIVVLKNGKLEQALTAASLTLQASLGMICDMIADRVEAPCLNRNVMAASTAISCANMALADYNQVIPLDEVIETMKKVGDAIPSTLRCTGLGGLAITKTAKKIEAMLNNQEPVQEKKFFKVC
jgi:hypothetical protein